MRGGLERPKSPLLVFLVQTKEPHAIGAYIRGSRASVVREDVISLDRFIKLSLGRQ